MLVIGLCDDDPHDRSCHIQLVKEYQKRQSDAIQLQSFESGEALLMALSKGETFDILVLDIYMGNTGIDGMSLARKIRSFNRDCALIFATHSPNMAIQGYGVRACQYLLKPLASDAFFQALDLACESLPSKTLPHLLVQNKTGCYQLSHAEIVWVESRARKLNIHLYKREEISIYEKLDQFTAELGDSHFVRPHKSYLVNLAWVRAIEGKKMILATGQSIPVSVSIKAIRDEFLAFKTAYLENTKA